MDATTGAQILATVASLSAAAATNPVRVADLINLPIVDENKSTMGRVRAVVRTGEGKIQLLLPLGGLFGFGERLVGWQEKALREAKQERSPSHR